MGQFSDDGLWWWDGTTWIATAQIMLPQLPVTEFERSGKLKGARSFMRRASQYLWWNTFISVGLIFLFPWLAALRDYRSWKLEQVALATAYLLGPHEAMLAGETSLLDSQTCLSLSGSVFRNRCSVGAERRAAKRKLLGACIRFELAPPRAA
jgi:hypothetical protein